MKAEYFGLSVHLILFLFATASLSRKYSFYPVLTTIVENNLLHLLHTSLLVHFLLTASNTIANCTLGPLSPSEKSEYNDRVYSMFSELVMVVSFFSHDLEMVNVIYFACLFAGKSLAWKYSIKAKRFSSNCMLLSGLMGATGALLSALLCWHSFGRRFSISLLFTLEYSLMTLSLLKSVATILCDLYAAEHSRSFYGFLIYFAYYLMEAAVVSIFIVMVTLHNRFPVNTARTLISILTKLRKKFNLFNAYLKLCRDLDTIPEVDVNGTCAICTENLVRGKMLACKHSFHADCLKMWCEHEKKCPICRAVLVAKEEHKIVVEDEVLLGIPIDA